jgi:hypothetical protein
MANNHRQFSESLFNLTIEEKEWLESQLQTIVALGDREFTEDDPATKHGQPDFKGPRFLRGHPTFDYCFDELGFEFAFFAEDKPGCYLWLHADDHGDPRHAAWLVQKFHKQFRPDQCWSLTYSNSCSKPLVGGFSGGAFFVTATEIEELHAAYWVQTRWAAFQQSHKPQGREQHEPSL